MENKIPTTLFEMHVKVLEAQITLLKEEKKRLETWLQNTGEGYTGNQYISYRIKELDTLLSELEKDRYDMMKKNEMAYSYYRELQTWSKKITKILAAGREGDFNTTEQLQEKMRTLRCQICETRDIFLNITKEPPK